MIKKYGKVGREGWRELSVTGVWQGEKLAKKGHVE